MTEVILPYRPREWALDLHNNPARFRVAICHRAAGKALALETQLATPDGFVTMGAIKIGDKIIDRDGLVCNVTATTDVMHDRDCYELEFNTHEKIICDGDHLWLTQTIAEKQNAKNRVCPRRRGAEATTGPRDQFTGSVESAKTTVAILGTLEENYVSKNGTRQKNHHVRVVQPFQLPEVELPIHPYLLGYWLGDGTSRSSQITVGLHDREAFLLKMMSLGIEVRQLDTMRYGIGVDGRFTCNKNEYIKAKLAALGVLENKHIPTIYLRASEQQRWELLQGLMDSDGSVSKTGGKCEITLINRCLLDDCRELAASLGLRVWNTTTRRAIIRGKDVGESHRTGFTAYSDQPIFSLPRKQDRLPSRQGRPCYRENRLIIAIRKVNSVPVRCIEVDSQSSTYCVGRTFIPTHNSIFAINDLIRAACTGPADATYLYVLPQQNQARRNVWDHVKHYVKPIPNVSMQNQTMESRFPNGARLLLLGSDNPDSLRGLHVHAVVLDEVDDMSLDLWPVIRPTLTTHRGRCTWIGTPKGKRELWRVYQLSQDPDRTDWHGIILPWDKTGVLTTDEIESIKSEMSPEMFGQELCCDFNAALVGAYFGRIMAELRESGRISYDKLYRPDLEVITAWDLGIRDRMSVWFMQRCDDQIFLVDYEEHDGMGFSEWSNILEKKAKKHGYRYGLHIAPHDIKNREIGTGISRLESAEEFGLRFEVCPKQSIDDGIEIVRRTLPKCRFDLNMTAQGVEALLSYVSKQDKDGAPIGPLHSWASHASDSIRYGFTYIEQVLNQPALMRIPLPLRR